MQKQSFMVHKFHFFIILAQLDVIERAFSLLKRHQIPFSLVIADLDNFKQINDNWGHAVGDKVLQFISEIFQNNCRKEDVPARIGGEEFAILLTNTTSEKAADFAERLRKELEKKIIAPLSEPLTCSFGITQVIEEDTIDSAMIRADKALYSAKNAGRNNVVLYK